MVREVGNDARIQIRLRQHVQQAGSAVGSRCLVTSRSGESWYRDVDGFLGYGGTLPNHSSHSGYNRWGEISADKLKEISSHSGSSFTFSWLSCRLASCSHDRT